MRESNADEKLPSPSTCSSSTQNVELTFSSRKKRFYDRQIFCDESSCVESISVDADNKFTQPSSSSPLDVCECKFSREAIKCLDELLQEVTLILSNRNNPQRLEQCQEVLELYRGSDWIMHCKLPEIRGNNAYGYTRGQVFKQLDFFDILILTWSPYTVSPIHNHPCERCFLMPLQGSLQETRYDVDEETGRVIEKDRANLSSHKAYWIDDSHGWHSMKNQSPSIAVSLHLYIPCYNKCKIIDPDNSEIRWVDCFPCTSQGLSLEQRMFDMAFRYFHTVTESPRFPNKIKAEKISKSIFNETCKLDFNPGCKPIDDDNLIKALQYTCDASNEEGIFCSTNQRFTRPHPVAITADFLTSCMNIDMHQSVNSPILNVMEISLLQHLAHFLGWHQYEINMSYSETSTDLSNNSEDVSCRNLPLKVVSPGNSIKTTNQSLPKLSSFDAIFTPGGSIANLMALHIARDIKVPEIREHGFSNSIAGNLVVFSSTHGHDSIQKAVEIMGIGRKNFIKVKVMEDGSMNPADLRLKLQEIVAARKTPFFVNCTAGTTVFGAFDPFAEIHKICREYSLWLHVDGSLGASFLLPQEEPYSTLCFGMHLADSVSWNLSKLLGVPLQCSALLVHHPNVFASSYDVSNCTERYEIWQSEERTLQSGRRADILKGWCLWKKLGDIGMANRIRLAHTHALEAGEMLDSFPIKYSCFGKGLSGFCEEIEAEEKPLQNEPSNINFNAFKLYCKPISCTCCFWWIPYDLRDKVAKDGVKSVSRQLDLVAHAIRNKMCGVMAISCYKMDSLPFLWRIPILNPDICRDDIFAALCKLNRIGKMLFPPRSLLGDLVSSIPVKMIKKEVIEQEKKIHN